MKLPKLFRRRKKGGKYYGPYLCKVQGEQVNLRTQILDGPDGAIERSKQARAGRREFRSDADRAVDHQETAPAPLALPAAAASPAPAAAPAPPAPPPAAPAAPPVQPDAVISPVRLLAPVPAEAQEEAAATSAAAAETAGAADGDAPGAAPPEFSDDVVDEMLKNLCAELVDAQLELQAAFIKRRTGKIAAKIPDDSKIRTIAASCWQAQLKVWLPQDLPLPPIVLAIGLPLLLMRAQARGATEPPAEASTTDIPAAA